MIEGLKFHHIGVACISLQKEIKYYSLIGYQVESDIFVDNEQGIKGIFLIAKNQPRLELLINHGQKGALTPWLDKGIKMYHICYKVGRINNTIESLEKIGLN